MEIPAHFIHQATRYMIGRRSHAVSTHCEWLINNWEDIPDPEKYIIQQDLEAEFGRDDRSRAHNAGPLGNDMDRYKWEQVRKLWKGGE